VKNVVNKRVDRETLFVRSRRRSCGEGAGVRLLVVTNGTERNDGRLARGGCDGASAFDVGVGATARVTSVVS